MLKGPKHCENLRGSTFIISYRHSEEKTAGKCLLLLLLEILALFYNILTADHKYSLSNRENLQQSIQMLLSRKQKNFFWFFHFISEIYIKFWTFCKNHDHHTLSISEFMDCKRRR